MTARSAAAGLMMLGGVVIIAGCVGGAAYVVANPAWVDARLADLGPEVAEQFDRLLPGEARAALVATAALGGVLEGATSIYVGAMVARGQRWAIGTSIGLTSLRLALVVLASFVVWLAGAVVGPTQVTTSGNSTILTTSITRGPASPGDWATMATLVGAAVVLVATLVALVLARRSIPPALPMARST